MIPASSMQPAIAAVLPATGSLVEGGYGWAKRALEALSDESLSSTAYGMLSAAHGVVFWSVLGDVSVRGVLENGAAACQRLRAGKNWLGETVMALAHGLRACMSIDRIAVQTLGAGVGLARYSSAIGILPPLASISVSAYRGEFRQAAFNGVALMATAAVMAGYPIVPVLAAGAAAYAAIACLARKPVVNHDPFVFERGHVVDIGSLCAPPLPTETQKKEAPPPQGNLLDNEPVADSDPFAGSVRTTMVTDAEFAHLGEGWNQQLAQNLPAVEQNAREVTIEIVDEELLPASSDSAPVEQSVEPVAVKAQSENNAEVSTSAFNIDLAPDAVCEIQ